MSESNHQSWTVRGRASFKSKKNSISKIVSNFKSIFKFLKNSNIKESICQFGSKLTLAIANSKTIMSWWIIEENPESISTAHINILGTVLLHACEKGDVEKVKDYLPFINDINFKCIKEPFLEIVTTPLHVATRNKRLQIMELLICSGANVNSRDSFGQTALHVACFEFEDLSVTCLKTVEILLKNNADVNLQDMCYTPLHYAVEYNRLDLIKLLISHGAEINARDIEGNNALLIACKGARSLNVINFLLENNAEVSCVNNQGITALHYCEDDLTLLKFFLLKGFDFKNIEKHKVAKFSKRLERNIFLYSAELEKMKIKKINTNLTVHDFLLMKPMDAARYVRNEVLRDIYVKKEFNLHFPCYGNKLKVQYKKGLKQRLLVDSCVENLKNLSIHSLPDECCEKIVNYLNKSELCSLTNSV